MFYSGPNTTIGIVLVVFFVGLAIGLAVGFLVGWLIGRRRRSTGQPPQPPQSFGPPAT